MKIPSYLKWDRAQFLAARHAQTIVAKISNELNGGQEEFGGISMKAIVVDAGNDILCDSCGDEITTDHVHVVEYGRRVACDGCHLKYYQNREVEFEEV